MHYAFYAISTSFLPAWLLKSVGFQLEGVSSAPSGGDWQKRDIRLVAQHVSLAPRPVIRVKHIEHFWRDLLGCIPPPCPGVIAAPDLTAHQKELAIIAIRAGIRRCWMAEKAFQVALLGEFRLFVDG